MENPRPLQFKFDILRAERETAIQQKLKDAISQEEVLSFPESILNPNDPEDWPSQPPKNHTYGSKEFRANDCSEPIDMTAVQISENPKSCETYAEPQSQRNATFKLLQATTGTKVEIQICEVTLTRLPYYCGMSSHQTLTPAFMKLSEPIRVTAKQCSELHSRNWWRDPQGATHMLSSNTVNSLYYDEVGTSMTSSALGCEGALFQHKGQKYYNMVVTANRKVSLFTETAILNQGNSIRVLRRDLQLPCPADQNNCVTDTATYLWIAPTKEETCPLFMVRKRVNGIIVQDDVGIERFMSTDVSMIRVILTAQRNMCNSSILATNYPTLFVTTDFNNKMFSREIDPNEVSAFTYSNQQDRFLYGYLTTYV